MTRRASIRSGGGAERRLSDGQWRAALLILVVAAWLAFGDPVLFFRLLILFHLFAATGFLVLRGAAFCAAMMRPLRSAPPVADDHLPSICILCPLYREAQSLPHLLASLANLDYPKDRLDIVVLLEADDHETLAAAPKMAPPFRLLIVPDGHPRTKPRALNHGLRSTQASIIGVYDAEDRPEPDQLRRVAAAFAEGGEGLACVQAQLNYYNRDDTIVTRMFALEYALQFDWFLPGLTRLGLPLPLGGTSNFARHEALEAAGGWDAYNVTEDADLGIRLGALGYRTAAVESTTFEEATDTIPRWVKQRSRWLKGFGQTWLVHTRGPLGWREQLVLHFSIGAVFLSAIVNPLTWTAFLAWVLFGFEALDPVFAGGFGEACFALFLGGSAAHLWFTLSAPIRRSWHDLATSFQFIPLYWVLQSAAGYKALYELIIKPHYWDKTSHSEGARAPAVEQNA